MAIRTSRIKDVATGLVITKQVDDAKADLPAGAEIRCPKCEAIAYVVTHGIFKGEQIMAEALRRSDGAMVRSGERICCLNCGTWYQTITLKGWLSGPIC